VSYSTKSNTNPMLDSRICVVEFPDGGQYDIYFNIILAEQLYAHVDEEGNLTTQLFKGLVGHRKNSKAVNKSDQLCMLMVERSRRKLQVVGILR